MKNIKTYLVLINLSLLFTNCSNKVGQEKNGKNLSATVDSLKQELNEMRDKQEIVSLAYRFSDAVMRADSVSFSRIWDDSAIWTIKKPMYSSLKGKSVIMKEFLPRMKALDFFINYPSNYTIIINGNTATALFYILEAGQFKDGEKGYYNYAVYSDSLIKKNGNWFFKNREYNYIYLDHSAMKGQPIANPFDILKK